MSEGWSADGEQRDYSGLIAHQTVTPGPSEPLPAPRPAICRAPSHGGPVVEVSGVVTHATTSGEWLAFAAEYVGWGEWIAWVARSSCTPAPRVAATDRPGGAAGSAS